MPKKIEIVKDFKPRLYQEKIFSNCINKNSLVILPTGLGKTIIAFLLMVYYFNKTGKKIIFLAPTKPLVEQHKKTIFDLILNKDEINGIVLTGNVDVKKRTPLYDEADIIFSTPQIIENDLLNNIISLNDYSLIIFDEAHRARGNYAYTYIAETAFRNNVNILGLTASPGSSKEEIDEILKNLHIENLEVRKYEDADIKPYVKDININYVEVEFSEELKFIQKTLNELYLERLKRLNNLGVISKNINYITKTDLLNLQIEIRRRIAKGDNENVLWKGISLISELLKLSHGIELFETQDIEVAYNYFYEFFRDEKKKPKAVLNLITDSKFRAVFEYLIKLKERNYKHPKLTKLKELLIDEFRKDKNLKLIIFTQFRDTAIKIVEELTEIKEFWPVLFVGQSKRNDIKLSQKEQKKVLDDFRKGDYNILVSTSVGEEGLDIPKVNLVVFYEPIPSAIRTIQRIGRTGRFKDGKVYVLITKGTRDKVVSYIAKHKEKNMYKILENFKDDLKSENNLNKFIPKEKEDKKETQKNFDIKPEKIKVIVDSREDNTFLKELKNRKSLEVVSKKVEVGDIIISENIGIERKTKKDFLQSLFDKRLFNQLLNLMKNFNRPILILEGTENIYSLRDIKPEVIRATISAISVDLRIPIIYTEDVLETSLIVETIAKRVVKKLEDKKVSLSKIAHNENEELENLVASIPSVNIVTSKNLLEHFKTIKNLVNAKEDELLEVKGVGKKRAKYLLGFFNKEYKR